MRPRGPLPPWVDPPEGNEGCPDCERDGCLCQDCELSAREEQAEQNARYFVDRETGERF